MVNRHFFCQHAFRSMRGLPTKSSPIIPKLHKSASAVVFTSKVIFFNIPYPNSWLLLKEYLLPRPLKKAQSAPTVTRWLDYFSTFGNLHEHKYAQCHAKLAKVVPKFCQIVNDSPSIAQDFKDFAKVAKFRQIWSHYLLPSPIL